MKSRIELFRHADGSPARSIRRDLYLGGVPDDDARIEGGKRGGNAPDKMPRTVTAGEEVRHDPPRR